MRLVLTVTLAAGLLALGLTRTATADDKADAKAMKELEGTYLLMGIEAKGMKLGEEEFKKVPEADRKIVIKDGKIIANFGGKEDPATIKLDASQTPGHITITSTKDGKPEVSHGIYKFEKGVLTICAMDKGEAKDRPKEFKVTDKEFLLTLKKSDAK